MAPVGEILTDKLAYMAGYVDADGSVLYGSTIRVEVTGCYVHILRWFQETFGGKINDRSDRSPAHRNVYRWYVTGPNAARCVRLLLPYLKEKQSQATIALAVRELPPGPERNGLIAQLKGLKRIDY